MVPVGSVNVHLEVLRLFTELVRRTDLQQREG